MVKSRLRGCAGNLLLLALSLLFACAVAEIYLRWFRPQPLEAAYVWPDGTLRHLPSFTFRYTRTGFSNLVRFNSLGLRGPEVAESKRPGIPRVLFLGDSFVEGKQVAESEVLTSVLEQAAAAAGRRIEVINAGVSGYGTGEELILWERLGRSLQPDLVLLGFYPNDVRNNADRRLFELRDGQVVPIKDAPLPNVRWIYDLRKTLASRSHLYMLIKQGLDASRTTRAGGDQTPMEAEEVFARDPSPKVAGGWGLTLALLDALRAKVEADGARFAIILFPTRFQVDDSLWRSHAQRNRLDVDEYDLMLPQRQLAAWSAASGATLIDLLDVFRAANRSNRFYHIVDAHWNPDGHRLAAETIWTELTSRGLIAP